MIKYGIKVMPREVILDSQGRAVEKVLKEASYPVGVCRIGKYIEITLALENEEKAYHEVKKMADSTLHNPLIETYEIQRLS